MHLILEILQKKQLPVFAGFLAGLAVSIAGNMHYVVYAQILPLIQKLKGEEVSGYWFPDATRYIGFNPDVPDKTIHEFPCYSFVLGDLHAHVVNVMFVLFLVGLLYAWMRSVRMREALIMKPGRKQFWKKQLLIPHILLAAMMIGMFRFTNFWDFIIYFVVTGGVVLFTNIVQFDGKVLPIEVKAETNVRAKSMRVFIMNHPDLMGVRFSMLPYQQQDWLVNVPLYACTTFFT